MDGHTDLVLSVVFSPDGNRLASCSFDKTVRLWDAHTGVAIGDPMDGHTDSVLYVIFSPDGSRLASCSFDKTVRLWDVHTGAAIKDPMAGHTDWVLSVVFSPDGSHLASCSADQIVRLWDAHTSAAIGDPMTGCINKLGLSVVFSPDGRCLAIWSDKNTVRLWNVHTGAAIGDNVGLIQWIRPTSSVFSPDSPGLEIDGLQTSQLPFPTAHGIQYSSDACKIILPTLNIVSNCKVSLLVTLNEDGWLLLHGYRVLWIPVEYRGYDIVAIADDVHCTVCIGGETGSVIFIRLQIDKICAEILPNVCDTTYSCYGSVEYL